MDIIYRDNDIVVLVKPSGVLSASDSSGAVSLPELIKKDLGVSEVFPIHRLDREVSGLMVYALNKKAAADLSAQAADHTKFIKEYMPYTVELGRSFVSLEYQNVRSNTKSIFALDNLWDGLGALTVINPDVKYFFGKMTMYPSYIRTGRDMILYFL